MANPPSDPCNLTLTEVAALLQRRVLSSAEITRAMLERIDRLNPRLHAYLTVTADLAVAQAQAADRDIARGGYRGPLHGVPIGIKDLCATNGIRTMCASRVLADQVPRYDATVVERLAVAGAVMVGKLNLTEFAMSGYSPMLPIPINPWNAGHFTGVSSSGSGVATAARLCFAAIGTDTGGSIRFPSACCGVTGVKPTYGRVSRHGVFPLAMSLDHIGPMARSVADCAAMLDAISGHDPRDPTSLRQPPTTCSTELDRDIAGMRIGVDEAYIGAGVEPAVAAATRDAVQVLAHQGATLIPVSVPSVDDSVLDAWPIICAAEAATAHDAHYPSRAGDYGETFRSFLEYAHRLTARDYVRAHMVRMDFTGRLQDVFATVDALACPSMIGLPPPVEFIDPHGSFSAAVAPFLRFTAPFNYSGNPTLSLPCGLSPEGLPHSLQLVGRHGEEGILCRLGSAYQRATDWHTLRPPGAAIAT